MFKQILWITGVFILFISTLAQAKIVFTSTRDGNFEIYVMNDDGSRVQRLTYNKFRDKNPVWSPDGKQIAFTRDWNEKIDLLNRQNDIFIMDADGSNQRNLTKYPAYNAGASWSPDGRRIAFTSNRTGREEIHIIDILTGDVEQLTDNAGIKHSTANHAAWSPDGKYIAYVQYIPIKTIFIMDVRTRKTKPLIPPKPNTTRNCPQWSSNGQHILFHEMDWKEFKPDENNPRLRPINLFERPNRLVIVGVDGSNRRTLDLPKDWWISFKASWSPHGKGIVFSAKEQQKLGGNHQIYKYSLATREITKLTNHPDSDIYPNWFNRTLSVSSAGKMGTQWGKIKR